jgi:branched-chain amino acid transport system substrate-binding protein
MKLLKTLVCAAAVSAAITNAYAADLKVGLCVSLSGPNSSLGIPLANGMRAAVAFRPEINGQKVDLIVLDDASDPTNAARSARKLVEENKVDVLVGASGAPAALAIAQVSRETKTPMIAVNPLSVSPSDSEWLVAVAQPPQLMIDAVVQRMKREKIKTVGYIGFSDPWGDLVYNALVAAAATSGIKVVANERYARSDSSVTGQVLRLMSTRPDAVMTGGSGTPGALPYLALRERGFKGPIYGQHALINADFIRIGGSAVEDTEVATGPVIVAEQLPDGSPTKKIALQFKTAYKATIGEPTTDAFSAYSFDAYLVFAEAASRVSKSIEPGTPAYKAALQEAIFSGKEVVGVHGVYNFKHGSIYGVDDRARVIARLENGKWKLSP